jgi:hypothetical protein
MDIYFTEDETDKALEDISCDVIFDTIASTAEVVGNPVPTSRAPSLAPLATPFAQRRYF